AKSKAAKEKVPISHPPVIHMVKAATMTANDREGTSLQPSRSTLPSIKRVGFEKLGAHIRREIVHAVEENILVRFGNNDKGAFGSFKVAD
ncbi:uncharacterized protein DEA37_0004061, partial [Paragonimus westermani]